MRNLRTILGVLLLVGLLSPPAAAQINIDDDATVAQLDAVIALLGWTTPTFDGSEFTGNNSMTWVVDEADVVVDSYFRVGTSVTYNLVVFATTIGGTPSTVLQRDLPASLVSATSVIGICDVNDGTLRDVGIVFAAGTQLRISHAAIATFSTATNAVSLSCSITFEVDP